MSELSRPLNVLYAAPELAGDEDIRIMVKHIKELEACLKLVMLWVENWNTPFTEDDEWIEDAYPRIQKAIYGEAPPEQDNE